MTWLELAKYVLPALFTMLATIITMLIRERNNFASRTMDLFLSDKRSWTEEREKLESRIDVLYEKYDKLRDKFEEILRQ